MCDAILENVNAEPVLPVSADDILISGDESAHGTVLVPQQYAVNPETIDQPDAIQLLTSEDMNFFTAKNNTEDLLLLWNKSV